MQVIDNHKATQLLSAWAALEVLSPQVFRRREDLVAGNKQLIASLDETMPWENGGEIAPKGKKVYYQIVIGTLHFGHAIEAMMKKYPDQTIEKHKVTGHAILAVLLVDNQGCVIANSASISSFAWGLSQVLKGKLNKLGAWPAQEKILLDGLDKVIESHAKNNIPLTKSVLEKSYHYLVETLSLSSDIAHNTLFATKIFVQTNKVDTPQASLLNSFYLNDLTLAIEQIKKDNLPRNLNHYLGIEQPEQRYNILDRTTLKKAVTPILIPPARWPGAGRHPLVMLQQAAVNVGLSTLKEGGILAVNGPPGTGKSTLLRDVIAGIVTKRALAMTTFGDPETAFTATSEKLRAGQGWLQLYELDAKLKGFEIVIASSNNKAVENVSAELPNINAIAADADELRYFKPLSDHLFGYDSWGLVAAVLGNSANRFKFSQSFWWNRDVGIYTYLAHICGMPALPDVDAKSKNYALPTLPKIVAECDPPKDHEEAVTRWDEARADFQSLYIESTTRIAELERVSEGFSYLETYPDSTTALLSLDNEITQHELTKPKRKLLILKSSDMAAWETEREGLLRKKKRILAALEQRDIIGKHVIDQSINQLSHAELHLLSPWCNDQMQLLRDKLFISAMKLHKAFIDAAAKPLRHNLGLFMQHLANPNIIKKGATLQDLWSTFSLVVPAISTTFASVTPMFGKIPSESIGWLLIDEAGQATPQAAVGAIMRAKRAIIVGDPMQIEPVTQLPSQLTDSIMRQFEVDPVYFNAPDASVQTLADRASSYYAELTHEGESRQIGVPLLVHRRCTEPMFNISNSIAYSQLMIQAKKPHESLIRNHLGPSAWFHVDSYAEDKWSETEGAKLLELLSVLSRQPIAPDIYILTPFVIVANRIREIILNRKLLQYWGIQNEYAWLYERVGTVHTVQGREAESIIFVLGAPVSDQHGARLWAGIKPNLLNVAVTRAKETMYVIGNKTLWQEAGVFQALAKHI